ncbi:MAG: hypothetical protein K8L99_15390, partial [Anaerolineae bacterium]|nr:hypothetical protein [Anaerolineae bacterium]
LLEVAFLFGANDEFFFFGSQSEITAILQGEAGLDSSARFQQASTYFITEPSSILYTDGPGLIATTVIPLALLGPSIGNVYDNIIEELENPTTANPEPQFVSYQPETDPVQILDAVVSMIESASITSSYSTSGVTLTRAIITLAE